MGPEPVRPLLARLDAEDGRACTVHGDAATIVVWSPDYDGKGKALVRLADGSEAIVGASRLAVLLIPTGGILRISKRRGAVSETMTYSVPAIHCEHCAMSIREEVSEVAGVEAVAVDLETKIVTVDGQEPRTTRAARGDRGSGVRGRVTSTATREPERRCASTSRGMTCAVVRRADRAQAEQARRRRGDGQLRDRAGDACATTRIRHGRRARLGAVEAAGYQARPAAAEARASRHHHDEPTAPSAGDSSSQSRSPSPLALLAMVPPLQFAGLGVGGARARDARRLLEPDSASTARRSRARGIWRRRWTR